MLGNGLGEVLGEHRPGKGRFVDLFAGSGAVAWHMGTRYPVACVANDLQAYSGVLAGSILYRVGPLEGASLWKRARPGSPTVQRLSSLNLRYA